MALNQPQVNLDVSEIMSKCKDFLTEEWAEFKKSLKAPVFGICLYSIGGVRDNSVSVLPSIAKGIGEWELLLKDVVDTKVASEKPILDCEVCVGVDGSIAIHPLRRKVNEKPFTDAYKIKTEAPAVKKGRKKKEVVKSAEEQFMAMVEQVSNYMLDHIKKMSQPSVPVGDVKTQYLLLGSITLVRNRINYYKELLRSQPSKKLSETLTRAAEMLEVLSQTIMNYHCDILRSCLLQDVYSNAWSDEKKYKDGERISSTIRMWIYYTQGIRNDLYRFSAPQVAEGILLSIFSDTLNILISRYMDVSPSEYRLPLYVADVFTILSFVAAMLPCFMRSPAQLLSGRLHASNVLSLHRRANLLLAIASVKAAPLKILVEHKNKLENPILRKNQFASSSLLISSTPPWLTFINESLYPPNASELKDLPPSVSSYHLLNTAACSAGPKASLIVRALIQHNFYASQKILVGLQNFWSGNRTQESCGGALCQGYLCFPAFTPQAVYAAIVQIVFRAVEGRDILQQVMMPGVMKPASWDSFDQNQVWNSQRPAWHHALVHLASPYVIPVVQELLSKLPAESHAQPAHPSQMSVRLEHHLNAWINILFTGVASCGQDFPPSWVAICLELQRLLPPTISPAGGHVISHVVICALYGILNSRSSVDTLSESPEGVTADQWDILVAISERLCSLNKDSTHQQIKSLIASLIAGLDKFDKEDGCLSEEKSQDPLEEYYEEELLEAVSDTVTLQVLQSVQGHHAIGVVWKFLQHNMEWLNWVLEINPLLPPLPGVERVAPQLLFADSPILHNPFYHHGRVMYTKLDETAILSHSPDWLVALESTGDWLSSTKMATLLSKRQEFKEEALLSDAERRHVETLRPLLREQQELGEK